MTGLDDMSGIEFVSLLKGIGPETALGRIVAIRSEDDKEVLKSFTTEQHRIRNEWRKKQAKQMTQKEVDAVMEAFKNAFIEMAGGSNANSTNNSR